MPFTEQSSSALKLTSEQIVIERIKVNKDHLPDEEIVRQLMNSISEIGLLQPIVLRRTSAGLGISLVFGRNRLEACKRLKHRSLLARVVNGTAAEIDAWCARATADENAVRRLSLPPSARESVISLSERGRRALAVRL
jgi:hypothetical protein